MKVGLKPLVDFSMQTYDNHTRSFQGDVGDTRNGNSLSPAASTRFTRAYDPKSSPILFPLSPDWKVPDRQGSEVEVSVESETQQQSLSAPEYEFLRKESSTVKQTEAYSAPTNVQIQSHSLFAFRASYSGAFLSTTEDFRERLDSGVPSAKERTTASNHTGLSAENSANAAELGLKRQDSDASVDDLIFREWRKMRPRTSLLRDDSMASLASLPRTESEISMDGERIHLDEGLVSNLKIDTGEDSSNVDNTTIISTSDNTMKENGMEKQSMPRSGFEYGPSFGILNPIIEQDSYMAWRNESRASLWEQYGWNGVIYNAQDQVQRGSSWNPSTPLSFGRDLNSSISPMISVSSSSNYVNSNLMMGNYRNNSVSNATSSYESDSKLPYKDNVAIRPTAATAAATAAIASATFAANQSIATTDKGQSMASEIYRNMENSLETRGTNVAPFSESRSHSSISSSHSWITADPSFPQAFMFPENSYRRNIIPFSPISAGSTLSTGNVSKVWSMEDVVGRIFELAKDQHGCRFLQMKLEEGNPAYIAMILSECLEGLPELMVDPFGNYLCQKLFECCNFQQRLSILKRTCNVLAQVSMNMHGTRVVQRIIECIEGEEQLSSICTALAPYASQLMKDVNGNHVIQRCLQKISPIYNQFIFDSVVAHCVELATHRHGCCVIQRCLDYAIPAQKEQVCMEICENAFTLVQDAFGNYVVQYVLDLKNRFYIAKIVAELAGHLYELSVQKFSSNVVEKCLQQVDPETRRHLIYELMSDRERLGRLLHDAYGNYVVQRALQLAQSPQLEQFCEIIRPHLSSLKSTPYGKRIYSKIVRRFPESSV